MIQSLRATQVIAGLSLICLAGCERAANAKKDRVGGQDIEVEASIDLTSQENLPPDGPFVLKRDDGSILSVTHFKDGKQHGSYKGWYSGDRLQWDENYDKGQLHGLCTYWYESGQKKSEFSYRNGKRHGTWTEWNEDGQVKSIRSYDDGELVSEK